MCSNLVLEIFTDKVIEMYERGCSFEAICEAYNLKETEVRTIINFYYY